MTNAVAEFELGAIAKLVASRASGFLFYFKDFFFSFKKKAHVC
jgi:hypothetical protein